jgi:DNA-directed RNA polymerase subunit K/omega
MPRGTKSREDKPKKLKKVDISEDIDAGEYVGEYGDDKKNVKNDKRYDNYKTVNSDDEKDDENDDEINSDEDNEWDDNDADADEVDDDNDAGDDGGEEIIDDHDIAGNDDDCEYDGGRKRRGAKKVTADLDKDDEDYDDMNDIELSENDKYAYGSDRIPNYTLGKYERVRIIGERTSQLAQGAKPMLKGDHIQKLNPKVVAQLELEAGVMPLIIHRPMPDGKIEVWKVNELRLKDKYIKYGIKDKNVNDKQLDMIIKMEEEYIKGGSLIGYRKDPNNNYLYH